jgi:predicted ATPase
MEFWLNCGQVLLEEEKYEEVIEYFMASLGVALQMTDEQKEKHIEIAYKLLYGTQLLFNGSLTKDEFYKDIITMYQFIMSEVKASERRAQAMFSIGFGKFLQGQEAEG